MAGTRFRDNPALYVEKLKKNKNLSQYLFPDVQDFLKNHSHHHRVLLSLGELPYQREKVIQSGILPFLDDMIFIEEGLKGDIAQRTFRESQEKIVFLDDSLEQIKSMEECCPEIVSVRMNREGVLHVYDVDYPASHEVKNLKEFEKLLVTL